MTLRLLQFYETLLAWRVRYDCPPTLAELARACGLKEWQCYAALVGLRARGLLRPGSVRGWRGRK